jgi:hypothetical protein
MHDLMQTIALIEISITCAVILIWLLQKTLSPEMSWIAKFSIVLFIGNLFFWPLGLGMELPLAAYVRAITGDLSIVSLLLLWGALLPTTQGTPMAFKYALALTGLSFYPFALGFGILDPYAWGYGSIPFFIAILLSALLCAVFNWLKGVWIIAFAILAWAVHWHESSNLWDYLLDPFLVPWGWFTIIGSLYTRRREKARLACLFRPG